MAPYRHLDLIRNFAGRLLIDPANGVNAAGDNNTTASAACDTSVSTNSGSPAG